MNRYVEKDLLFFKELPEKRKNYQQKQAGFFEEEKVINRSLLFDKLLKKEKKMWIDVEYFSFFGKNTEIKILSTE